VQRACFVPCLAGLELTSVFFGAYWHVIYLRFTFSFFHLSTI
jgi:hypothetical protein